MIADLHIHTRCSRDSLMDPARVVKVARMRGLAAIAVTDHNTIRGGLLAREANPDEGFEVVVGAEIKTEYGDVRASSSTGRSRRGGLMMWSPRSVPRAALRSSRTPTAGTRHLSALLEGWTSSKGSTAGRGGRPTHSR